MAWGECGGCGRECRWEATRGARLADARCPECGGALRGKTAGQQSAAKGRRYERCVVCDRRGLHLRHPERPWREKWAPREARTFGAALRAAGAPVCGFHEPVTPCHLEVRHHSWSETVGGVVCWRCNEEFSAEAAAGEPCLCGDPEAWARVCPVHLVLCLEGRTEPLRKDASTRSGGMA